MKKKDSGINKTFVVTYRCNFKCPYCYETAKKIDMSKKIADLTLKQLFDQAIKEKKQNMRISFFGGEPLLKRELIRYIVQKCRKFCKVHRIKLLFSIITNGSLFDAQFGKIFHKGELDHVQVTIDGPREIHNKRRMYLSGRGTYDDILKKLPNVLEIANRTSVRINVDHLNIRSVPKLLNDLEKFKSKNLKANFALVNNFDGRGKNRINALNIKVFSKRVLSLEKIAKEKGLLDKTPLRPKVFYCAASTANPSWVDPYGDIYCCQHALGHTDIKLGSIFSKIDEKMQKNWLNYSLIKNNHCLKCKQVYFCGGACPMFFRKGYIGQDLCYNFDKILLSRYA